MARKGNGSSAKLVGPSLGSGLTRLSIHLRYRNDSVPGSGDITIPVHLSDAGGANYSTIFAWNHSSAGSRQAWTMVQADHSTQTVAKYVTSLQANTWYDLVMTWDGSNLKAYLNGALETTTAGADPDGAITVTPKLLVYDGAPDAFWDDGEVAELAVWSVALDAAEANALGKGFSPYFIRPASRLLYAPLIRETNNWHGTALTDTSTTVTDHPGVIYPFARAMPPGLTTVQMTQTGSVSESLTGDDAEEFRGESATVAEAYRVKGIALAHTPYLAVGRHRPSPRGN